jgi:ubiquinone/menaquinone biosynthesis C-methylase UbiE
VVADWERLRQRYEAVAVDGITRSVGRDQRHYQHNVDFVRQRFQEGVELAAHFEAEYRGMPLRILDLGAGSGGVSIALANVENNRVVALDVVINEDLATLRRRVPLSQVIATADRLPFRSQSFDVVLCLETIEHLREARTAARECIRILRSGGQVMITTPARLRFLTRPDPHYQVRGLMLLPDGAQRRVVVDKLKLTRTYDVEHIFWTAGGVIRLFPSRGGVETLVAIPPPGRPRNLREILWKLFRRLLWDRIVIYKM